MNEFPQSIQFRYQWRTYQKKILADMAALLQNKRVHLVAPPGSGKTVLGLELMVRLNKPTFILAPTVAIRNQWAERFLELFWQGDKTPDWISTDIRQPAFVTIATYQGLHSLCSFEDSGGFEGDDVDIATEHQTESLGGKERKEAYKRLLDMDFQTLIVDEAHHLRAAWWKSTIDFRRSLNKPTIVALTATPPYDVSQKEWKNYIDLCGPIDAEIHVAELVKEGDLCPHQDYIYATTPTVKEAEPLLAFHNEVTSFMQQLKTDKAFISFVEQHRYITDPANQAQEMLANQAYFSSLLIFLHACSSEAWKQPAKLAGLYEKNIPPFEEEWAEELLDHLLFKDAEMDEKQSPLKEIRQHLQRIGAIERRKVTLRSTKTFDRSLVNSLSKLDAMTDIVSFEASKLEDKLRLVILADYIRLIDLPKHRGDEQPLTRLGVIPIFEQLRRHIDSKVKLAVLTGSTVIIPTSAKKRAEKEAEKVGLELKLQPLAHDPNYLLLTVDDNTRANMVSIITAVFTTGGIHVLIGTTALLGEGWDAPSINTLIMASYVGSFMLSNQMRGRALRIERDNPNKTANIWHMVCIDTEQYDGGHDCLSLQRRFKSLIGLGTEDNIIESGINRLAFPKPRYRRRLLKESNEKTFAQAANRQLLADRWKKAVAMEGRPTEEISADARSIPRPLWFGTTLKAMIVIGFLTLWQGVTVERPSSYGSKTEMTFYLVYPIVVSALFAAPFFWKAIRIWWRNSTIEKSMESVGEALYKALHQAGIVETPWEKDAISTIKAGHGTLECWLKIGTTYEKTVFLKALQEVIDPIEDPRYLLYRQSKAHFRTRKDYFAVPTELGRKKATAEMFHREWKKHLGKAELVYTRSFEGRQILLQGRVKAMSAVFVPRSERISAWR